MMIRFDFEGALDMARQLVATEGRVLSIARDRQGPRDRALRQEHFVGPEADLAVERAEREDQLLKDLVPELDRKAAAWAAEWAHIIGEQNQEKYEQYAEIIQRENLAKQRSYFNRVRSNPDGNHRYPKMGSIEPPRPVLPPTRSQNFSPEEPPFVSYHRSGLDYEATYSF